MRKIVYFRETLILLSRGGDIGPYFLAPVAHELFERASHFVHVKLRLSASAPGFFLACRRMEVGSMGM